MKTPLYMDTSLSDISFCLDVWSSCISAPSLDIWNKTAKIKTGFTQIRLLKDFVVSIIIDSIKPIFEPNFNVDSERAFTRFSLPLKMIVLEVYWVHLESPNKM